jgi:hypothetical protein
VHLGRRDRRLPQGFDELGRLVKEPVVRHDIYRSDPEVVKPLDSACEPSHMPLELIRHGSLAMASVVEPATE